MEEEQTKKSKSVIGKLIWIFFLIAVLFFISAVSAVVYNFMQGNVFIDSERIDITFDGPRSVDAQDEVVIEVNIHNRNNATLRNVDLIVSYPEDARYVSNPAQSKSRERISINDLASGGRHSEELEFLLVGTEGSTHELHIEMEFSVPDSNARLLKEAVHSITIGDAPVAISITPVTDIHSTHEAMFNVEIRSRSDEDLSGLVLRGEYPGDFEFTRSDPAPDHGDDVWIFDIEADELKTFEVRGVFSALEGEERTIRFSAGTWDSVAREPLGLFTHSSRSVRMRAPHISVDINLNNVEDDGAIFSDQAAFGGVRVQNNLDVPVRDLEVELDVDLTVIDPDSIEVKNGGFFDENASKLVWSYIDNDFLEDLARGRAEYLEFSFSLRESAVLRTHANPEESLRATVRARQSQSSDVSNDLQATAQRDVKVMTRAGVSARGFYSVGPFDNTGPFPPRLGESTTYTIVMSLTSSVNTVHNGRAVARLPEYVEWSNAVAPSQADVRYISENREVVWDISSVEGGRGESQTPVEIAFQVNYTPRPPHQGSYPVLVEGIRFRGTDSFVNREVTATGPNVTVRTEDDPDFDFDAGRVR